ncbi:hypothetical protein Y032_0005g2655 [Ancylostoma ceylanicum]|uniref:Uncharacterized protein n=1 Tax=Ancylostoma ceylanicum TaxID=53326 RepID=A0A016VT09_9BILA|nr:hypothetical protein Y032_0005g2655 [Ancylostoma ceylanicum]
MDARTRWSCTVGPERPWAKGGVAARALRLSAAPPEAAGNHEVSVFFRVPAQKTRCLGAADNQSTRAAVQPLVYDRLEFIVWSLPNKLRLFTWDSSTVCFLKLTLPSSPRLNKAARECSIGARSEADRPDRLFQQQPISLFTRPD